MKSEKIQHLLFLVCAVQRKQSRFHNRLKVNEHKWFEEI